MIKKQQQFIPKGMNQDIAQTKVQSEFAHSIKNLRVVTDEKDGTLSLVTEKGTSPKTINNDFVFKISPKPSHTITETNHIVNFQTPDGSYTLETGIDFRYNYYIKWYCVKIYFFNQTLYDTYKNLSRDTFARFIDINNNLVDTVTIQEASNSHYYEVDTNFDTNLTISITIDEDTLNKININVNSDSSTSWDIESNDNDKSLTFYIPTVDFRYVINNDVNKNKPCQYASSYINTEVENWKSTMSSEPISVTVSINYILGNCTIDNNLYLFCKCYNNTLDGIFVIENFNSSTPTTKGLYIGNLNFNINNPIKTYVSYENEKTIKIYWIDGLNQPRVINVKKQYELDDVDEDNHFEFNIPVYLKEIITINKRSIGGFFHSGVIQYFMTYVDQNDQESKIFYTSPLYYLTDADRALAPDENSTNSFVINIVGANANNLQRDKLRIYSLHRSSLDAIPVTKLVYEIKLTKDTSNLSVVDTGNVGSNIDPQILLTLGCDNFIPQTFAVKDQTMFFGNIEIKDYQQIPEAIANNFRRTVAIDTDNETQLKVKTEYSSNFQLNGLNVNSSVWNENGSDSEIKGFMYNEEYMLGLQFLHKSGTWSEPIWVCDKIMSSSPYSSGDYQYTPYFYKYFNYSYFTNLIALGYIAVRPLVVFNDKNNSRVLCQGLINPTIKYKDNYYPSWFFRYFNTVDKNIISLESYIPTGFTRIINSRGNNNISGEVQGFDSEFTIKDDLVTFNSPEIEFEKITNITNSNYAFTTIGYIGTHANNYDIEMLTSTVTYGDNSDYGLKAKRGVLWYSSSKEVFVGGFCWKDKDFAEVDSGSELSNSTHYVWPWENNQSYSFAPKTEDSIVYSAPERKIISNYRYSQHLNKAITNKSYDASYIALANNSYLRTTAVTSSIGSAYIKDVDILVTGTPTLANCYERSGDRSYTKTITDRCNIVRIQYKTTPHIVLKLENDGDGRNVFYSGIINGWDNNYGNVIIGELINSSYDSSSNTSKFKGRSNGEPTETSMYENTWYVAGDTIKLPTNDEICIKWTKGDTYYQRYDCLKTYPYSHEAQNSIIDVLSCMIQTRINLDGRYDKNRCSDILHIDPTNFNKLNDVYSQTDNFFTYRKLDPDRFQNIFPNLVTWSKQKVFGETSDSWTNVHLTNVLDLDGNLGEITAIKLWNNKLIAFQNRGISVIKYNENVIIPTASGAPIELRNSGKVTGKEYLTNQFGCQNEWSIVNAKSGLYFSDDYNHKLYVLSDGIKCISDNLGFKSYLKTKNYTGAWKPNTNTWTLANGGTLHTFYDQQLGEIYFTDGEDCLTFNENLNLFTAFYDYKNDTDKKLFDFVNIENKNYWILNNFTSNAPIFYEHRATDNLNIFETNRDYSIELTSNIDPYLDKVFDTVEIRGDAYISNNLQSGYNIVEGVNTTSLPFDKLQVSNEYQDTGEQTLNFIKDKPYSSTSNMKQKFRIWRAAIGRNKKNNQNTRDRIRNYWSRVKLTKNGVNNLRAKIHDIVVDVYE